MILECFFRFKGLISVLDDGNCPFCSNLWVGFAAQYLLHGFSFCRVMGMFGFRVFELKTESSLMESRIQCDVIAIHGTSWAMR
jgi:predicted DCC family thiol-disulfide oxidoreductase YuxK